MKGRGPLADPSDKARKARMGAQGFDGVEAAGKLGLGQGGVDFVVTDLMQQYCRAALAAAQAREQVVQALLCLGRDRAFAKRADGKIVLHD